MMWLTVDTWERLRKDFLAGPLLADIFLVMSVTFLVSLVLASDTESCVERSQVCKLSEMITRD